MARRPRQTFPGALQHVIVRGNARQALHAGEDERAELMARFEAVAESRAWVCLAYAWLTNHAHLLLETPHGDLSDGARDWLSGYARFFNRRRARTGHVFEDRVKSILVTSDRHLLELTRYLPLNAVRAGLCARPERWPYASYAATLGLAPPSPSLAPERVLELFASDPKVARERYRAFVERGRTAAAAGEPPPRWVLSDPDDLEGVRVLQAMTGASLRTIAPYLGIDHTTLSRRLRRT